MTIPIIPGAYGFGIETCAGRGGELCVVDSLREYGPGTLREALEFDFPRTVVFAVSGTIELRKRIEVWSGNVRVAGQTSPGAGITIVGAGLGIFCDDVCLQHLRIRPGGRDVGPGKKSRDALLLQQACRVIIDHCSLAWAPDEVVDVFEGCEDITFLNTIIAEGLENRRPDYPDGEREGCGIRIGPDAKRVALINCWLVNNGRRNPLVTCGSEVLVAGSVLHNYASQAIGVGGQAGKAGNENAPTRLTVLDNTFLPGRDTNIGRQLAIDVDRSVTWPVEIYSDNNRRALTARPDARVSVMPTASNGRFPPTVWLPGLKRVSPSWAGWTLPVAGAQPADAVDQRIRQQILKRSGRQIESETEVEGLPLMRWEDNREDRGEPGTYTPLEQQLNTWKA